MLGYCDIIRHYEQTEDEILSPSQSLESVPIPPHSNYICPHLHSVLIRSVIVPIPILKGKSNKRKILLHIKQFH